MRTRLGITKRISDDIYVTESFYPRLGRPNPWGMLLAFLIGAGLFIAFGLIFIAVFAP